MGGHGLISAPLPLSPVPRVSVLLPLRDGERFVREAVDSILAQTFTDFELIVVDDGSTDGGPDLVRSYDDPRLRLVTLPVAGGISRALHAGLAVSTAALVARMDADDVSLPERFAAQVAFLAAHPEVVAVGVTPVLMDQDGGGQRPYPLLTRDAELRRRLTDKGPFCHGSVLMRRSALEAAGGYRSEQEPAEDYGLWLRLAAHGQLANLPQALYRLRIGDHSVSFRQQARQQDRLVQLRQQARAALGDPALRWAGLRAGRRFYRAEQHGSGLDLEACFVRETHELVCLDLLRRGPLLAGRNLLLALALSPFNLRRLRQMWRFYRQEHALSQVVA